MEAEAILAKHWRHAIQAKAMVENLRRKEMAMAASLKDMAASLNDWAKYKTTEENTSEASTSVNRNPLLLSKAKRKKPQEEAKPIYVRITQTTAEAKTQETRAEQEPKEETVPPYLARMHSTWMSPGITWQKNDSTH